MSKSAFSVRVFAVYMIALGALLIAVPNQLLSLFAVPETQEVWIRIVGVLVLIIGYLDFMASRNELQVFFRWTVAARFTVPVFITAFVLLGVAPPILMLFGAIDAAGAIWTWVCLRKDNMDSAAFNLALHDEASRAPATLNEGAGHG